MLITQVLKTHTNFATTTSHALWRLILYILGVKPLIHTQFLTSNTGYSASVAPFLILLLVYLRHFNNVLRLFSKTKINYVSFFYEIATVTASNPWPWANMLRNMNEFENGWSNFPASFRVVALKLTELILFALAHQWFSSTTYVPLHREWRHHELSFPLLWACVYFRLSIYFAFTHVNFWKHCAVGGWWYRYIWEWLLIPR